MVRYIPNLERLEDRLLLSINVEAQHLIYLLNRARHDPAAYQRENQLPAEIAAIEARPPLAVNDNLVASANFHSQEMAVHDYFGHQSPVTGDWPNKMVRDHGYPLPSYFPNDSNNLESLAAGTMFGSAGSPLSALIVDEGIPSLGHRKHLLAMTDFNASFREVGVGYAFNAAATYDHYWTIHTGLQSTSDTFLTGVTFHDVNMNDRYDPGEGLAGVSISAGTGQTLSNAAGGWSLRVAAGTHLVQASGGGFQGLSSTAVVVTNQSIAVDFRSGMAGALINFEQQHNLPPIAQNDIHTTQQAVAATVPILANDSDPEGQLDLQSVFIIAPFQHGTATVDNTTGAVLYTPAPGFLGTDEMRYRVNDASGAVSNEATVVITVLPADMGAWRNAIWPLDVSNDTIVTPVDALTVINDLNASGARILPPLAAGLQPPPFLDVNGDGRVSPVDVLHIINHLNAQAPGGGEAEAPRARNMATERSEPPVEHVEADAWAHWAAVEAVIADEQNKWTARQTVLTAELEAVVDALNAGL